MASLRLLILLMVALGVSSHQRSTLEEKTSSYELRVTIEEHITLLIQIKFQTLFNLLLICNFGMVRAQL